MASVSCTSPYMLSNWAGTVVDIGHCACALLVAPRFWPEVSRLEALVGGELASACQASEGAQCEGQAQHAEQGGQGHQRGYMGAVVAHAGGQHIGAGGSGQG